MSIAEFYGSLNSIMVILFVLTAVLILVYEYNLHRRGKRGDH